MTMRFHTDDHFCISKTHMNSGKPCQDYALSGICNSSAYLVVSDGCSNGGRTDVGARLVALSTSLAIKTRLLKGLELSGVTVEEFNIQQRVLMQILQSSLGLKTEDMFATCAYACLTPQGGLFHLLGDGVFACRAKNGKTVLSKFVWNENMPFYPAYADDNYRSFISAQGGDLTARVLKEERWIIVPGGDSLRSEHTYSLQDGINGVTSFFDPAEWQFIAIFSDGITQISGVDWEQAAIELMSFKSLTGEFAKRRLIKFLKEMILASHDILDDIAFAVAYFEEKSDSEGEQGVDTQREH